MRAATRSFTVMMLTIGFSLAVLSGSGCPSDPVPDPIPEPIDLCPDDPDKTEPGDCGCAVPDTDTDGDGTPDCNDDCPNDPNKTVPGICGCGTPDTDTDGDGTPDCNDDCPNDPNKTVSGICGCGTPDTDTDGDGTPDCNDDCPNDPDKTEPGDCGCGVAETDTDGDGTPDCNDDCPNDPDKTETGDCGCGVAETDTDGDGTPDCLDDCPNDPDKTAPGICGCGLPETCVLMDTVTVGNPGNGDDSHGDGYGGVADTYSIGKYEVTAGQYAEFLNAVAATDTYGLYSTNMNSDPGGCQITRNGSDGNYTYDFSGRPSGTEADWTDRPVNYVSWGDAARFANWLHNGQQRGAQDLTTTEDGSYHLNGATTEAELNAITREGDAKWVIPSENEWYKAAYHKNDGVTSNYFDYPTSSDSEPSNDLVEPTDPGNNATFIDPGHTIGSPYYRTEFGAHENSESPYGTFDQGGNVWEWNEAVSGSSRVLRGGSFNYSGANLHPSVRETNDPTDELNNVGFRVVEMPE